MLTRCRIAYLLVLTLLTISLAGCLSEPQLAQRPGTSWSRATRIGQAGLNQSVAGAVGAQPYVAWITSANDDGQQQIAFAILDTQGRVSRQEVLPLGTRKPSQVRLTLDQSQRLHLTWTDTEQGARPLFHATLDSNGHVLDGPELLSPDTAQVDSYAIRANSAGGINCIWGDREGAEPGLYYLEYQDSLHKFEGLRLQEDGFDPALVSDEIGERHLAWYTELGTSRQALRYARMEEDGSLSNVQTLVTFSVPLGVVAHPPCMAILDETAYLFWSRELRGGGLSAPSGQAYYLIFPLSAPEEVNGPNAIRLPATIHPDYAVHENAYGLNKLAIPLDESASHSFTYLPSLTLPREDQLAVAFVSQLSGRTQDRLQVVLTLWQEGEMLGYQIAGLTSSGSLRPQLLSDAEGNLHLLWIDTAGFGEYDVFYASTAPHVRKYQNRFTLRDALSAVMWFVWSVAQAMGFVPFVLVWLFLPMAFLVAYVLIRPEDVLSRPSARSALYVAIGLYVIVKYLLGSRWLAALPVPQETPMWLANLLAYIVPLLISGLAAWLCRRYIRKHPYATLFPAFGVFAISDALLTLLIYVPGLLAE